jgi:predicted component of type VI protein secretion system
VTDLIFVEQKPMEGREQALDPGATIGREGCDVVLMDPEVSRRHAAIRDQGGNLAIEDLGSTNGTFVNDVRIAVVTVLRDGDEVRLGNTVWAIRSTVPSTNAGATGIREAPIPGAPQVTTARAVPSDIEIPAPQPTTAQQVPQPLRRPQPHRPPQLQRPPRHSSPPSRPRPAPAP